MKQFFSRLVTARARIAGAVLTGVMLAKHYGFTVPNEVADLIDGAIVIAAMLFTGHAEVAQPPEVKP